MQMQNILKGSMRGQVDLIYLMVWFFVAGLVIALTLVIWTNLTASPSFESVMNATHTGQVAQTNTTSSLHILANAVIFIFIFAAIASVIAAAFANSSPAFVIVGIIVFPVEIIFSFLFHDFFLTIVSNSAFSGIISQIPGIIYGFTYLPIICLILAVISIVITFIKP